jgi:hypothetical protein
MEQSLFAAAPRKRPPVQGGTWVQADPLTTFEVKRFAAIRAYQGQQGREISRCLRELRLLRKDALADAADELPNEPGESPANDDVNVETNPAGVANEPGNPSPTPCPAGPVEARNEPGDADDPELPAPRWPVPPVAEARRMAAAAAAAQAGAAGPRALDVALLEIDPLTGTLADRRWRLPAEPRNEPGKPGTASA